MTYGRGDDDWDQLAAEGHDILLEDARNEDLTYYTRLNNELKERTDFEGFDFSQPADRAAMGHLLFLIVEREQQTSPFMLSALVKYVGDNAPGTGFYKLAEQQGLLSEGDDKLEFWSNQLNAIYDKYSRRRQRLRAREQ